MVLIDTAEMDLYELYRQHWRGLVRLAVLLVDDLAAAEDVVQDAFLGLHRKQDGLRSGPAALAYLRTSVVNGSRSVLRKRGTVRRHLRTVQQLTSEPADAPILRSVERQAAMAAVRALPNRQREVLVVLRYWSELSEAEIAATLGISAGSVKSAASRGLDSVEKTMRGQR